MKESSPQGGGRQEDLVGEVASKRAAAWVESKDAGWGRGICGEHSIGSAGAAQGAPTSVTQAHSPVPIAGAPNIAHFTDPLVEATIKVYSTITSQLLPTPAKSHYTFNLRDLSKVFQGMLMADPAKVEVRTS